MTINTEFTEAELRVILWAVEVASDAITIKSASGDMPNDDAMHLITALTEVEDKLEFLLAHNASSG